MDARYSRQEALPGFGADGQRRLAAARVLVIGAGGLGSSVIPALAGAGVGTLAIVDDDRVELSNLHRQTVHAMADVGHSKAESAAQKVAALNPEVRVRAIDERLSSANALELFAEFDLVVDGSDNFPTRYLADDAARLTGIPVVWGAVSQYGGQAGLSWAAKGPTYRDLFPVPPAPGTVPSCEVGGVLPTTVAVIGAIMATEAIKVLTGIGSPAIGRATTYDALSGGFRTLEYAADPSAEPVTGLIDYAAFCGLGDSISPRQLAARTDDFTLLDVREPWEVDVVALPGALSVPLGELELRLAELDPAKPVVAYCHHGIRSASARLLLADHGFTASHLEGGIDAWARELDPAMARY